MDLDVSPSALIVFCESQHFIGALIRPLGKFYRRSTTDKRALKSCVTLLRSQTVYVMCKMCVHTRLCVRIPNILSPCASQLSPTLHSHPFQYTLKQCCRKFSHIVVLSEAFH